MLAGFCSRMRSSVSGVGVRVMSGPYSNSGGRGSGIYGRGLPECAVRSSLARARSMRRVSSAQLMMVRRSPRLGCRRRRPAARAGCRADATGGRSAGRCRAWVGCRRGRRGRACGAGLVAWGACQVGVRARLRPAPPVVRLVPCVRGRGVARMAVGRWLPWANGVGVSTGRDTSGCTGTDASQEPREIWSDITLAGRSPLGTG